MKHITYLTCVCSILCGSVNTCYANPIQKIDTTDAPVPRGPFSQAISIDRADIQKMVFVSGQVAADPKKGKIITDDIHAATNQTLDNVEAILKAAGSDWKYVVRVDVFLQNFDRDRAAMNEEYSKRFHNGIFPARQTVGVQMGENLIEISCIAIVPR